MRADTKILAAAVILVTSHLLSTTAHAFMSGEEIKAAPRLYAIDIGKEWLPTQREGFERDYSLRPTRPACGSDTFVTISNDFDNALATASRADFFATYAAKDVTPMLRNKFYPGGELFERKLPTRGQFGNTEAYNAEYLINLSAGKRYRMAYHFTFVEGYKMHIYGYAKPKEWLRASVCFKRLFDSFRVRDGEFTPPVIEDLKPKSKYFN